MVLLG